MIFKFNVANIQFIEKFLMSIGFKEAVSRGVLDTPSTSIYTLSSHWHSSSNIEVLSSHFTKNFAYLPWWFVILQEMLQIDSKIINECSTSTEHKINSLSWELSCYPLVPQNHILPHEHHTLQWKNWFSRLVDYSFLYWFLLSFRSFVS